MGCPLKRGICPLYGVSAIERYLLYGVSAIERYLLYGVSAIERYLLYGVSAIERGVRYRFAIWGVHKQRGICYMGCPL